MIDISFTTIEMYNQDFNHLIKEMNNKKDNYIDPVTKRNIEASVFRKMIQHLQKYPEIQNIDLMNLAFFCRNCFSKWYMNAAKEYQVSLEHDQARSIIYGMPFDQYKKEFQKEATDTQMSQFQHSQLKATE